MIAEANASKLGITDFPYRCQRSGTIWGWRIASVFFALLIGDYVLDCVLGGYWPAFTVSPPLFIFGPFLIYAALQSYAYEVYLWADAIEVHEFRKTYRIPRVSIVGWHIRKYRNSKYFIIKTDLGGYVERRRYDLYCKVTDKIMLRWLDSLHDEHAGNS